MEQNSSKRNPNVNYIWIVKEAGEYQYSVKVQGPDKKLLKDTIMSELQYYSDYSVEKPIDIINNQIKTVVDRILSKIEFVGEIELDKRGRMIRESVW